MNVREMTHEQLLAALKCSIDAQREWADSLGRVMYWKQEAPGGFIKYGHDLIWEHGDRIEAIEMELERRTRVKVMKTFCEMVLKNYET